MNTTIITQSRQAERGRGSRLLEGSLGLGAFVLLATFVWTSLGSNDSTAKPESQARNVAVSSTSKVAQQRIADLRVGDRVLGENPEVSDFERATFADPDPATWRKFILRLAKPDGHSVDIELLRPLDDDDFTEAQPGQSIYLDLHELGAEGDAEVLAVEPCPAIRAGAGNVVTGTFRHSATNLIDLHLAGETHPIGCTVNHPFWSVDREEFIPAGDLLPGEKVLSRTGAPTAVVSSVARPGLFPVYNLEVNGEHVYYVSHFGILVHNYCAIRDNSLVHGYVYKLTKNGQTVYVGISKGKTPALALKNLEARLASHAKTKNGLFDKMEVVVNQQLKYGELMTVEANLITRLRANHVFSTKNAINPSNLNRIGGRAGNPFSVGHINPNSTLFTLPHP